MTDEMILIERPKPTALVAEMAPVVALARSFAVTDIDSDRMAQEYGQKLRRAEKSWTEYCEPARKKVDEAKKAILALRDGILGPWAEARSIFFAKSDEFQAAERRKAEDESRRLQALARKEEEERQLLAAIEAEGRGDTQEAEAILREPLGVPVVTVAPAIAKVEGVSSTTRWSAEVHDLHELVKYVAGRPEWISLLEPAMPNLNRLAVAQREALEIPGVRAVSKTVRSSR